MIALMWPITGYGQQYDTLPEAEYLVGTGYTRADDWYKGFTRPLQWLNADYRDWDEESDPGNRAKFAAPCAILLSMESRSVFVKLPYIESATSLSKAETLIHIRLNQSSQGKHYDYAFINLFDIDDVESLTGTGIGFDEPPEPEKLFESVSEMLSRVLFVSDGSDMVSAKDYYMERIGRGIWNNPQSKLHKAVYSGRRASSSKRPYRQEEIMANLEIDLTSNDTTPRIRLNDNTDNLPENENWLVVIRVLYRKKLLGHWVRENDPRKTPISSSFDRYYRSFIVQVRDGAVIEQKKYMDKGYREKNR
jgi:hypothetical protein